VAELRHTASGQRDGLAADDGAITIRVRRDTQVAGIAALFAFAGLFAYITLAGPGPNSTRFNPVTQWILVVALVLVGLAMLRSLLRPRFLETVIDGHGIRDGAGGRTMRWADVWKIGYTGDGREIWVAPYPDAAGPGIDIDVVNSDADDAEILVAIERFSRAAGRELELPEPHAR
jgi:hypothetical protein